MRKRHERSPDEPGGQKPGGDGGLARQAVAIGVVADASRRHEVKVETGGRCRPHQATRHAASAADDELTRLRRLRGGNEPADAVAAAGRSDLATEVDDELALPLQIGRRNGGGVGRPRGWRGGPVARRVDEVDANEAGVESVGQPGGAPHGGIGGRPTVEGHGHRRCVLVRHRRHRRVPADTIGVRLGPVGHPLEGDLAQPCEANRLELRRRRRVESLDGEQVPVSQPSTQRFGCDVDELELVGRLEQSVGHGSRRSPPDDRRGDVRQALDVSDAQRPDDIDPAAQQPFGELPTVGHAAVVGRGEVIDDRHAARWRNGRGAGRPGRRPDCGHERVESGHGLGPVVGRHRPDDDRRASGGPAGRLVEQRARRPGTGRHADVQPEPAAPRRPACRSGTVTRRAIAGVDLPRFPQEVVASAGTIATLVMRWVGNASSRRTK